MPVTSQYLSSDTDARSDQRRPYKDRLYARFSPVTHDHPTRWKRYGYAQCGDSERSAADLHQFARFHFESHAKEEEHDTEVGQRLHQVSWLDPVQNTGPYYDAGENLADNAGLVQPLEKLGENFGAAENQTYALGCRWSTNERPANILCPQC